MCVRTELASKFELIQNLNFSNSLTNLVDLTLERSPTSPCGRLSFSVVLYPLS